MVCHPNLKILQLYPGLLHICQGHRMFWPNFVFMFKNIIAPELDILLYFWVPWHMMWSIPLEPGRPCWLLAKCQWVFLYQWPAWLCDGNGCHDGASNIGMKGLCLWTTKCVTVNGLEFNGRKLMLQCSPHEIQHGQINSSTTTWSHHAAIQESTMGKKQQR